MKKELIIRLQMPGMHIWSECDIEEVSYLANVHRHMFHFEARCLVGGSNREVEFIKLQNEIRRFLTATYWSVSSQLLAFGGRSCEMIAEEILKRFPLLTECTVLEDGENGARVVR